MAKTHNLADLEIVGYSNVLTVDLVPRIVPPIFRFRSDPARLLIPPFRLVDDHVEGGIEGDESDLDRFVGSEQATRIQPPIQARPVHHLWIDQRFKPHYGAEGKVIERLRAVAKKNIPLAWAAIHKEDFDKALQLAQTAIAADELSLDALLVKAVVDKLTGHDDRAAVLSDIAAVTYPGVSFDALVDECSRTHAAAVAPPVPVPARVGFSNDFDDLAGYLSRSGYPPFDDSEAQTEAA